MSDPALPADPSDWPTDPYQLLGVTRGASPRELRKAYLRLIKIYKPEHSPDEFQRIRRAYELTLGLANQFEAVRPEPPFEPGLETQSETKPPDQPLPPSRDPWELAAQGDFLPAYECLASALETEKSPEESYLRLYWILTLRPVVDPARLPIDWLIQGIERTGSRAGRLRELLRRELASDSSLALGKRVLALIRKKSFPDVAQDVAIPRWRAARLSQRWGLIVGDIQALRAWLPSSDLDIWARLLLSASFNLAWAEKPASDHSEAFCAEAEQLSSRQHDYSAELYQVEFAQILKAGLDRLDGRPGGPTGLAALLSSSWDDPAPRFQVRLNSYIDQIVHDPALALEALDQTNTLAAAVLGRLSSLLGGLENEAFRPISAIKLASLAPVIGRFLDRLRWTEYPTIRVPLLRFCLREEISPGLVARTLADRPEFVMTGKSPLAQSLMDDLPLRHVYRACELSWERHSSTPV